MHIGKAVDALHFHDHLSRHDQIGAMFTNQLPLVEHRHADSTGVFEWDRLQLDTEGCLVGVLV